MTSLHNADQYFSEGFQQHLKGDLRAAAALYQRALERCPDHAEALHHLGLVSLQSGAVEQAVPQIQRSIEINPLQPSALSNLGYCLNILGQHDQAAVACRRAVDLNPSDDGAWTNLGNAERGLGLSQAARTSYQKALRIQSGNPIYLFNVANSSYDLQEYQEACRLYRECLAIESRIPQAHNNLAACLLKLGDLEAGLQHANVSVELKPDYAEAWCNRGNALHDLRRHEEALASYQEALQLKPDYAEAWANRGNVLFDTARYDDAVASYRKAIEYRPDYAQAWGHLGNALLKLRRYAEALASHERAIELQPNWVQIWGSRGNAFIELSRFEDARVCYQRAIELNPECAQAWRNLGNSLRELTRYEEAIVAYQKAIMIDPGLDYVQGDRIHTQMIICDWSDLDARIASLETEILAGQRASAPFPLLGLVDSPRLQRKVAESHAADKFALVSRSIAIAQRPRRKKIRIGYFSMDFREHPVAHLIMELIERHDRDKFEVYGFSLETDTGGAIWQRFQEAFDEFLDVSAMSEADIARVARHREIDIAVDLGGYTQGSRPLIFAERAAPIQINYLGYPGTFGSDCMDYIVGDAIVVTDENREFFSEKIITLPNQFQVNPSERPTAEGGRDKRPQDLPEGLFVFCCFNNSWKITPQALERWARILNQVPSSVLWLHASGVATKDNLKRAFKAQGVDSSRILFANRVSREDYLAQLRWADLFLDTLPYNAGTTASDALWMGLPILTLAGKSFAGRMAASLLYSIGLPELVTETAEAYEALAIKLATDPQQLAALKAKLAKNRLTAPLFNTKLFARHIETAYQAAYDRYQVGLAPDHITIAPA